MTDWVVGLSPRTATRLQLPTNDPYYDGRKKFTQIRIFSYTYV